jgi:hypothetical protein
MTELPQRVELQVNRIHALATTRCPKHSLKLAIKVSIKIIIISVLPIICLLSIRLLPGLLLLPLLPLLWLLP